MMATKTKICLFTRIQVVVVCAVLQRLVMKQKIDADGTMSSLFVETMRPQNILQSQQFDVRPQCHLSRAISVEIKLVLNYLREVLKKREKEKRFKF